MADKRKNRHAPAHKQKMPLCSETTNAGNPCPQKAAVVFIRGKQYKLKTCAMHAPAPIKRELNLFQYGHPGKAGRKKKKTALDLVRERIEGEAERYLQPLEDALIALKAVVVGNGASAHIEYTEDLALRVDTAFKILDRVYGKPKQTTELSGVGGDAIEIIVPSDDERKQSVAAILASTGALGMQIPQNNSASAPSTN